jgi:hypothetical protein
MSEPHPDVTLDHLGQLWLALAQTYLASLPWVPHAVFRYCAGCYSGWADAADGGRAG